MKLAHAALILLAGLTSSEPARAAVSCVSSANGIQSALTVAETNSENDTIKVEAGSYTLAAGLTFDSSESRSLTISGGWNIGCTLQTNADTALDGQNSVAPLTVSNANGAIHIERLTFQAGKTTESLKAPIAVSSNNQSVYVDSNSFFGNKGTAGVGALSAYAGSGGLYVRNNLFVGNHGALLGAVFADVEAGQGYVNGNTMVANITDTAGSSGGLGIGGSGYFQISNNILWNNAGATACDFRANANHSRYANDIGVVGSGVAPGQVVDEQYVDPQFAPCSGFLCFNFELSPLSPLVDAGIDAPLGAEPATDLAGKPRLLGAHIDIGAYENEVIFVDGFQ